jgi:hypothetical protein
MRALALAVILAATFAAPARARLIFDPGDSAFTGAVLEVFDASTAPAGALA